MPVCPPQFYQSIANENIRPIESYWLIDVPSEYCINATIFNIVTGVINTISDFLVYLWPIQFLWIIQIPVKQKLGVIFLFVIGVG